MSQKAAKEYIGSVENLENGSVRAKLSSSKALAMAKTYDRFHHALRLVERFLNGLVV